MDISIFFLVIFFINDDKKLFTGSKKLENLKQDPT